MDGMNRDTLVRKVAKELEELDRAGLEQVETGSANPEREALAKTNAKVKVDPALAEAILAAMRNAGFNRHGVA